MAELTTVSALRPDTSGHYLVVKVIETKPGPDKPGRAGGKPTKITECLVGDETGTILFSARNEQVDQMKPGSYVSLINAKIDMFRSNMRLAVDKAGKIEPAEANFKPKTDYNLSFIEYELVPIPDSSAPAEKKETTAKESEDA